MGLNSGFIVQIPDDIGVEDGRGGMQDVNRRQPSFLIDGAGQGQNGVKVRKHRLHALVHEVIAGNINGFNRAHHPFVRRHQAFMELGHFRGQRRLVSVLGRNGVGERGKFIAGLGKPEDVIDKKQDIPLFPVAEMLGNCYGRHRCREPYGRVCAHSAKQERCFPENLFFRKFR